MILSCFKTATTGTYHYQEGLCSGTETRSIFLHCNKNIQVCDVISQQNTSAKAFYN